MTSMTIPHRLFIIAGTLGLLACGHPTVAPSPATPEATIEAFLDAVNAVDLDRMAALWGDERGPSDVSRKLSVEERRQIMTIMQRLLRADSHRMVSSNNTSPTRPVRTYEMAQGTRTFQVPFTCAASRYGGWLVADIGLDAAMPAAGPRP
jgi:hypothetical protein